MSSEIELGRVAYVYTAWARVGWRVWRYLHEHFTCGFDDVGGTVEHTPFAVNLEGYSPLPTHGESADLAQKCDKGVPSQAGAGGEGV